jgi:hypothetical protein
MLKMISRSQKCVARSEPPHDLRLEKRYIAWPNAHSFIIVITSNKLDRDKQ